MVVVLTGRKTLVKEEEERHLSFTAALLACVQR